MKTILTLILTVGFFTTQASAMPNDLVADAYSISFLEDGECTVTVHLQIGVGGDWKIVKAGTDGSIEISSTQSTCREAVADVKDGIRSFF